ncbi:MAG: hypothetical protein J7L34_08475, partial [Thermotogaceae bacterium]|nr:hypothetical protein [Thermotogaceae bacterium]
METVKKVVMNLKKYLVLYALLALITGWIMGVNFSSYATSHKDVFSNLIILFVFLMIYPMMVNMDWGEVRRVVKEPKA